MEQVFLPVFLVFKKCREADEDILFVDASKEFEKQKNQNVLLNAHINKIVDTYQNRTVTEKFSHKATLQEVADNDYNLNIPRYVDTLRKKRKLTFRR